MQAVTTTWLKNLDALKEVPVEQLQWLIDNSDCYTLKDGESLFEPGKPLDRTLFLISGRLRVYFLQNGRRMDITDVTAGSITGYLPFSRAKTTSGYGVAAGDTQLMTFPVEKMRDMIRDHFELTQALVHVMSNRVRDFTTLQQQNEKMMALGKLSAGLAHELNNPASAITRDSESLIKHLEMQPKSFKNVISIRMLPEQVDAVSDRLFDILCEHRAVKLTLKQRTEKEDEIATVLDEFNIENSEDMAENFVDFGFEENEIRLLGSNVPDLYLPPVFNWINNLLLTEKMVQDIRESSRRIAELVNSVKSFTHMDRAQDKQYSDIHTGISNTLTMLGYKVRKGNINVIQDFDESLPPVKALVGELNQVWTNLIDNALDAMEPNEKGTLIIKTEKEREFVKVSIIDDGPGIPDDAKSHIFEPFFTTKAMGKGTGMGLEVVQRIVQQHRGSVKAESVPGKTQFIVCFPIDG